MRLIRHTFPGLAALAALAAAHAQPVTIDPGLPSSGTEMIAKQADIELEIVGDEHAELPDLWDGYKSHGGFSVNFRDGGINYARLDRASDLIQELFVFYRRWRDEQPMDARAVGCPAERYHLKDPVACFRAIQRKMEPGRGPVLLEVRLYGMGQRAATIPINTVQIPWMYVQRYASMEMAE